MATLQLIPKWFTGYNGGWYGTNKTDWSKHEYCGYNNGVHKTYAVKLTIPKGYKGTITSISASGTKFSKFYSTSNTATFDWALSDALDQNVKNNGYPQGTVIGKSTVIASGSGANNQEDEHEAQTWNSASANYSFDTLNAEKDVYFYIYRENTSSSAGRRAGFTQPNITITYTPSEYTVTFEANGGTVSETSRQITPNNTIGSLPTPTRTGYTFIGWYTASSGGNKISSSTIITNNITYYAQWTANTYTVTFNPDGGTVNPTTKIVTYGQPYGSLPTPTKANQRFYSWWLTTSPYGSITENTIVSVPKNHTVRAQWSTRTFTVKHYGSFNSEGSGEKYNGASSGTFPYQIIGYSDNQDFHTNGTNGANGLVNADYTLGLTPPEGYRYDHNYAWIHMDETIYDNPHDDYLPLYDFGRNDGEQYPRTGSEMLNYIKSRGWPIDWDQEIKLAPNWVCDISYDGGDGAIAPSSTTKTHYFRPVKLSSDIPVKEKIIKEYYIHFDPNGGECDVTQMTTHQLERYGFLGWLDPSGETTYQPGQEYSDSQRKGSITLQADWLSPTTIIKSIDLPTPFREESYEFLGWSKSKKSGDKYLNTYTPTENDSTDITLYAIWKPLSSIKIYDSSNSWNNYTVKIYDSSKQWNDYIPYIYDSKNGWTQYT